MASVVEPLLIANRPPGSCLGAGTVREHVRVAHVGHVCRGHSAQLLQKLVDFCHPRRKISLLHQSILPKRLSLSRTAHSPGSASLVTLNPSKVPPHSASLKCLFSD